MNEHQPPQTRHAEILLLIVAILTFWVAAVVVWWFALWHNNAYVGFGFEFPDLTRLLLSGVQLGLPFILAALLSAGVIWQILHPGSRSVFLTAWLLLIMIAYVLFAMVAVTLPMVTLCGDFVPPTRNSQREMPMVRDSSVHNRSNDCVGQGSK